MNIGQAVEALIQGKRVTRDNWNGPGQYLELQVPDENSKMTLPYVYIYTVHGNLIPWLCSQADLLCNDWSLVDVAE